MKNTGKVWLIGAGPGDMGLLTIKGLEVLNQAQVVVYDALVSLEILTQVPKEAETINVGKRSNHHTMEQSEINKVLLEKAKEGKKVVRLKGGDPFVFGRGGEELELLSKEGIPFEIIPGITSSVAVPAYNGIPVTHREYSSSFHVVTGHKKNGKLDMDFSLLVKMEGTLVFLMGVSEMEVICTNLIEAGMEKNMPAAVLEKGTTAHQKRVVATVSTLPDAAKEAGIQSPAIIVVGKVCNLEDAFAWAEKRPLAGRQILITRPKERDSRLASKLRMLGAQVIEMPAIHTIPILQTHYAKAKSYFLEMLEKVCKEKEKICITFTSPRGVRYFFKQAADNHVDMRQILRNPDIQFAVVGSGTKKELVNYNIFPDIMPDKYSTKDLGAALAKELTKDTTVFLFRAKDASEGIIQELDAASITHYDVPSYETVYETNEIIVEKVEEAFHNGEITEVTFTSGSTVDGFVNVMKHVDFTKVRAVCIGERTAQKARKYKMQVTVSKEATLDSMVETIVQLEAYQK